jgi:hypothetical protein
MPNEITRRAFASSALILGVTSLKAKAETFAPEAGLLEAAADAVVEALPAKPGKVRQGDTLFVLKSFSLLQQQRHLTMIQETLDLAERPFLDGRIQEELDLLKTKAENFSQIAVIMNSRVESIQNGTRMGIRLDPPDNTYINKVETLTMSASHTDESGGSGTIDRSPVAHDTKTTSASDGSETSKSTTYVANPAYIVPSDAMIAAKKADSDFREAALVASHSTRRKDEALAKIHLAKDAVAYHLSSLSEVLKLMTVTAHSDGTFTPLVSPGFYVVKGHILGRLTI